MSCRAVVLMVRLGRALSQQRVHVLAAGHVDAPQHLGSDRQVGGRGGRAVEHRVVAVSAMGYTCNINGCRCHSSAGVPYPPS